MGRGTNIGGSIRAPAANNGVYGLKPTTFRIPLQSLVVPPLARESIIAVAGPLTRSEEDIHLFMKTILDVEP